MTTTYKALMLFLFFFSLAFALDLCASGPDQTNKGDLVKLNSNYDIALEEMRVSQNFYWLVDGVIAGMAEPKKNNQTLRNLKTLGIGTVISLNGFEWDSFAENDINHISYDLEDPILITNPLIDAEKYGCFSQLLKEMVTATAQTFSENPTKAVVIHCKNGISRTGALLTAWLQIHHKETIKEIIETPYSKISKPIQKIKKSAHPGLFILLKKDIILLEELLALRDPETIAKIKTQLNNQARYTEDSKKLCERPEPGIILIQIILIIKPAHLDYQANPHQKTI